MVPWYIWINKDFQKFYKDREGKNVFTLLSKVRVYTVKQSFFVLLLDFNSIHYMKIVEDDSEQLYDHRYNFGRSHRRKLINETKVTKDAMLRRVHRSHEKLKRRNLRRELRIKYNIVFELVYYI